jgi:UDP-glucose 4-epimerase
MKNIVVTGATSFIGTNLIKELLDRDYFVYAIVRPDSQKLSKLTINKNIKIVEIDISDLKNIREKINEECSLFYHLAWNGTRGSDRDNFELQQSNLKYSIDAVKGAKELGCSVFIGAGSQAEYGVYNSKITEEFECRPLTEYGKAKLQFYNQASDLCRSYGIHFKHPRFFSLYGSGDNEGTMLISMILNMLNNKDFALTQCVQMWDFLHIFDAVNGMIKLAEANCADGAYNFGSGDSRKLKDFVEVVYQLTGSTSHLFYGQVPYSKTGPVSIQPDVSKLKRETGWEPKICFEDGIRGVIAEC